MVKKRTLNNAVSNPEPSIPKWTADQRRSHDAEAWLAAIVENSEDAILSKTLDGVITTWNAGAEKLFGFTAREAIGQSITMLIPIDRLHEEEAIIRQLRAGSRVDQFTTVRRRKNGTLVDISVTVSPVRDADGKIMGASKIARDITASRKAAEQQDLILREMNHRIKNLFALTTSLVALSARTSTNVSDLAADLISRFQALARAHSLTLPNLNGDVLVDVGTDLRSLVETVLSPYNEGPAQHIIVWGDDLPVGHHSMPTLGLLFHELATNAAKYGALASNDGRLAVQIRTGVSHDVAEIQWSESGGPKRQTDQPVSQGFGSRLENASIGNLNGEIRRTWSNNGLQIQITFPLDRIAR